MIRNGACLVSWLSVLCIGLTAQAPGTEFTSGFGDPGAWAGSVKDTVVFDDGSGPAMYAVGGFAAAGDVVAAGAARWRRGRWEAVGDLGTIVVGTGLPEASSIAVFNDGTGPALFVAMRRWDAVASVWRTAVGKWINGAWSQVGPTFTVFVFPGTNPVAPYISTLHVADLGAGARLYAGGRFNRIGAVVADSVAQYDGVAWSQVGNGLGPVPWSGLSTVASTVDALEVSSVGGLARLYAAGAFKIGATVARVARFDGATWTPIGVGQIFSASMNALRAFNDGSGEKLYIGGDINFILPGSADSVGLLAYDGVALSVPAVFLNNATSFSTPFVRTLGVRTVVGAATELVIAGDFTTLNGVSAPGMARLAGGTWGPFPGWSSGPNDYATIAPSFSEFDDGDGHRFYYGTSFAFDGTNWGPVDRRIAPAVTSYRRVLDLGDGPRVFGSRGMTVLRRETVGWSQVCTALPGSEFAAIGAMESFDEGAGPRLFLATRFANVLPSGANSGLLRFHGGALTNVGAGVGLSTAAGSSSLVRTLLSADLGAGPRLYVGGTELTFPGLSGTVIAAWNGQTWSDLGTGMVGSLLDTVVFDDGSGLKLYAAGIVTSAGGAPVANIARWNGTSWSPVGAGLNGPILDLQLFDAGGGPQLYAAGNFTASGSTIVGSVARWNGSAWESTGLPYTGITWNLESFDPGIGEGPRLYAAGNWSGAPGSVGGLASFDGKFWTEVPGLSNGPGGPSVWALDLTAAPDADRPSLYINGQFGFAGSRRVNGFVRMAAVAPKPSWSQSGPGAPGTLSISSLTPGAEIYNFFSIDTSGPFGLGPLVGLYAADLAPMILQASLPPGTEPFQITAANSVYQYGPLLLPAGLRMDVLSISWGEGQPIFAPVERILVQ